MILIVMHILFLATEIVCIASTTDKHGSHTTGQSRSVHSRKPGPTIGTHAPRSFTGRTTN